MTNNTRKNHGASKATFKFAGHRRETVTFEGRPSVLELAISNGFPLNSSCGGMGTCTTCRVFVRSDLSQLPARNEVESEMAKDRNFESHERLGCQLEAYNGLEVEIPTGNVSED